MARNLILGKYYCALSHAHSSADEVEQCNKMEDERQKREYEILKQNHENMSKVQSLEKQRLDIEQQKIQSEKQKQEAEILKQKQEHEKYMAEVELKKLEIERDKKKLEYEEKMANLKAEKEKQKTVSSVCVLS